MDNPIEDEEGWLRPDCRDLYLTRIIASDGAVRVGKRGRMLRFGINHAWPVLTRHPDALVLEFGVHTGRDVVLLNRIVGKKEAGQRRGARTTDGDADGDGGDGGKSDRRVVIRGFDSFRGLPEDWDNGQNGAFDRGKFDLGGTPPDLRELAEYLGFPDENIDEHVVLHAGWFEDTVPAFFDAHPDRPVAFCHADADLHGSTVVFLDEMCRRRLLVVGSVITFDEYANYPGWEGGEYRAWAETVEKYGIEYEYICYHAPSEASVDAREYNPHGYQSVSVAVTKVPW